MKNQHTTKLVAMVAGWNLLEVGYNLVSHFYGNTASVQSKLVGVSSKYTSEMFYFYESPLTKDANPTTTNVIREGLNFIPNIMNAAGGAKHTEASHELQDITHVLGQTFRLGCKIGFQYIPMNETGLDPVAMSRLSNIGCDGFGVAGQKLSKAGQPVDGGFRIYYLCQGNDENIKEYKPASEFFKEKITFAYMGDSIATAVFKAGVLDLTGETIKRISNSAMVNNITSNLEYGKNKALSYSFDVPMEILEAKYLNIYQKMDAVLEVADSKFKAYAINSFLIGYTLASKILEDLYITGPVLLSTSNDVMQFFPSITQTPGLALSYLGSVGVLEYFKEDIFSHIENIGTELLVIGGAVASSKDLYQAAINSHPVVQIGAVAALGLYSHYKDDVMDWWSDDQ
jgi:hypothetical protein